MTEATGTASTSDQDIVKEVLSRCESIGDNCEFGFVQRHYGLELGGLFRWTTTPLPNLLTLLKDGFKSFYNFENLIPNPTDSGMVIDTASGIGFHSRLKSRDGKFLLDDAERQVLYAEEKHKVDYLVGKLHAKLADSSTIFVYKATWGADPELVAELLKYLRGHAASTLLYVEKASDVDGIGRVENAGGGLIKAYLGSFAPWESVDADHIDLSGWTDVVLKANSIAMSFIR